MNAQEMFKELGYDKITLSIWIYYVRNEDTRKGHEDDKQGIIFHTDSKTFSTQYLCQREEIGLHVNVDTFKAIHKQMEELGWV